MAEVRNAPPQTEPLPDPLPPAPPWSVGRALRRTESGLRLLLAFAWIGLGATGTSSGAAAGNGALTGFAFAALGFLALGGIWRRAVGAAGLLLALFALAGAETGRERLVLLGISALAALWLSLWFQEAGRWLARVRALDAQRARALAATELARVRAREATSEALRASALRQAGDAYERAGELRAALEALGADPGAAGALVASLTRAVGVALRPAPGLRGRLEAALAAPLASPRTSSPAAPPPSSETG